MPTTLTITCEAEAEEKTSETIIQKIFDELPVLSGVPSLLKLILNTK